MSAATRRAAYKRHTYSGPRKALKRVQGGLRRYYDVESRLKAWRSEETKKKPVNEKVVVDNSIINQNPQPRTYACVKPKICLEATFSTTSTSTVTAEPMVEPLEITSKDIENTKQECKEYNKNTEMAFGEMCRICLCVNVHMSVLKKTDLQNLYKTLTNSFMDENEGPIIVCFTCHARLIRCRRLQQQAIESNAVLEQLLAEGSMSIPKQHEARDEIKFTPIYHLDIRPVDCDIENDCKDDIFSLDCVKVEEENFENENSKFEENGNHETETAEKQEDLEIDAFENRHTDLENDFPLITFGSMSKEESTTVKLKNDIELYITSTHNYSEPSEKKFKSNSNDSNINVVRKESLDFEGPTKT